MERVERALPRHRARLVAERRWAAAGLRDAPVRIRRYLRPARRRAPASASVNFVTVHDGFTLNDLVSYDRKHNEANTENNRDGSVDNRSWNCGAEGPTSDSAVNILRVGLEAGFPCDAAAFGRCPVVAGR